MTVKCVQEWKSGYLLAIGVCFFCIFLIYPVECLKYTISVIFVKTSLEFGFEQMTQTNLATEKVRRIQREADTHGLFRNLELTIQAIHTKIVLHKKEKNSYTKI